jgi:hypothetical protein
MDDEQVKAMNRHIQMGWEPSRHQWQVVADRCKALPEMREQKVWGIRDLNYYTVGHKQVKEYQIVTNPQFFHPRSIIGGGMTYDEAEAMIKILES